MKAYTIEFSDGSQECNISINELSDILMKMIKNECDISRIILTTTDLDISTVESAPHHLNNDN